MVKKLQKMARKQSADPSTLAAMVKDSAQHIWLAGMGAFAKAQAEGGKVFEALMKEGSALQRKTQGLAEDRIGAVTSKMSAVAEDVSGKAGAQWDKLENIFEQRVAKALEKMGVPSRQDIDSLIGRIDSLSAQGRSSAKKAVKRAAAPARKTAARKAAPAAAAATKRAPRKRAAASTTA
jgi:poly(hydroxyalkanoate) granule-associated protein